ncbi:MAG: hypothetical protein ABS41_02130 [Arenimonas sp. SCN 70-307]|uniref:hypothetical protein n=1 Tax=Arenimonas sp. SCN 70-307 TaxID=1660089 RepID=UPI00086B289E|nr:hypothetical protein [Arenimonas sp. SCN 70-307]ODS64516.1 MAG: hypothetical protein ABS41_02130 [Arenimonas sp. SCN 70-307]
MRHLKSIPLALAAALAAPAALACGEGIFNMGEGLRYEGYLAPRPATILVFEPDGMPSDERIAIYRGLARAGHKVSVATDASHASEAFASQSFDVVVADDAHAATLASLLGDRSPARRLLVAPGKPPRDGGDASRAYVRGSASVGTWLGALNRLLKD